MNVPNTLTVFRILLIPVFIAAYFLAPEAYFYLPAVVLAVSGLTDVADGYIARRFHQITPLGRFLDPVADKLTMASVTICLAITHAPLRWLFGIYFVKEMTLALAGPAEILAELHYRQVVRQGHHGAALHPDVCGDPVPRYPGEDFVRSHPAAGVLHRFVIYFLPKRD